MADITPGIDGMPRWALRLTALFCGGLSSALLAIVVWLLLGAQSRMDAQGDQINSLERERASTRVEISTLRADITEMKADIKTLLLRVQK